jgi:hypothetical protein
MKLFREENGLYSGALKIVGERVEFAVSVGDVPLRDGRNNHSATLDANLQATQGAGNAFQGIIGGIEMVLYLGVRTLVQPARTQQQVQGAQGLRGVGQPRIAGDPLRARDGVHKRGTPLRLRLIRLLFVRENCGSINQETVPSENSKSQTYQRPKTTE